MSKSTEPKRPRGRPISTARGVLRRALALVQYGWTRGYYCTRGERRGRTCYCADGAMSAALDVDPTASSSGPRRQLLEHARLLFRESAGLSPTHYIPLWNDAAERTKREVVAAFQKAIKLAA